MLRRNFIKDSSAVVIGLGVFGYIYPTIDGFTGDTPTTTDILGPFYRPGAPLRKNINPPGFEGKVLNLYGTVFAEDGKKPIPGCLVEIWQCQADGLYDNISEEYVYRGCQRTNAEGQYSFVTTKPIPYPVEGSSTLFRPAHIHMRISVPGNQDLITQLYFKGDANFDTDPSTKSGLSISRILSEKNLSDKESEIKFDIVLKKEYLPDDAVFHKVAGIYKMNDNSLMEFYRDGDLLFYKMNNQILGGLAYAGNNSFIGGVNDTEAKFELLTNGRAKVRYRFIRRRKIALEGIKFLHYDKPTQ